MRQAFIIILCAISFLISGANIPIAAERPKNVTENDRQAIKQINSELKLMKDSLKEVRRDQLNYSIEKNLLKEAYASNIQTINVVITIILAVFVIIGYSGVKSISSIREDFRRELDELRALRNRYEDKFAEIDEEQIRAKKEFEQIRTKSQEQDKRLQILEIQEKVGDLMREKQYMRALEYLTVGLDLSPKDDIMLRQKMGCHSSLSQFPEAIKCGELILSNDPDQIGIVSNLAELYLMTKRLPEYDELIQKRHEDLSKQEPYLFWYFSLLNIYVQGDSKAFKEHMKEGIATAPKGKTNLIRGWVYDDAKSALAGDADSPMKEILWRSMDFLQGNIDGEELDAKVKELLV